MSRIIISRNLDNTERVVVGWDRPLGTYFLDILGPVDDKDRQPIIKAIWSGEGPTEAGSIMREIPLSEFSGVARRAMVKTMLEQHKELDYPQSNVEVDLTAGVLGDLNV
jgi:hypothetical protein